MSHERSLGITVVAALTLGIAGPTAANEPGGLRATHDLVVAPLVEIGQSPARVREAMGEAELDETRPVVGRKGEAAPAVLQVLTGDGWAAGICRSGDTLNLSEFRIDRSHRALPLPVAIGDSREEVEAILGPPAAERPRGRLEYRVPPSGSAHHHATLEVTDGRLSAIEWSFGLDGSDPCKEGETEARQAGTLP